MSQKFNKLKYSQSFLIATGWFIPGFGHYQLGKKFRAALFFVAVTVLFWLGMYLRANITFPNSNESFALFKFLGALGGGFNFFISLIFHTGTKNIVHLKEAFTHEYGNTCLYTAGILNYLTMIDIIDVLKGRKH